MLPHIGLGGNWADCGVNYDQWWSERSVGYQQWSYIGWQNLNLLSHPIATLAPQARQAMASGENLNYMTLTPQATHWVASLISWYKIIGLDWPEMMMEFHNWDHSNISSRRTCRAHTARSWRSSPDHSEWRQTLSKWVKLILRAENWCRGWPPEQTRTLQSSRSTRPSTPSSLFRTPTTKLFSLSDNN